VQEFTKATIQILALNEVRSLYDTVETILETCEHADIERINLLLAEHATPGCRAMAERLREESTDVPVGVFRQNSPSIPEVYFRAIQDCTASHMLLMSSDGETDPHAVHLLIEQAKSRPDCLVVASRWIQGGGFENYGWINQTLNYGFQWLAHLLYRVKMTDASFVFGICPQHGYAAQGLRPEEQGFSSAMEFKLRLIKRGMPVCEVPVSWKPRQEGKSNNSFLNKLQYLKPMLRTLFLKEL